MRQKELAPLFEQMLLRLSGFTFDRWLLLMAPLGPVLRAVHFDPSAFSKESFSVTAFMMPFCIPSDHYHMTFGVRLRYPSQGWSMDMPDLATRLTAAIQEQALPFLSQGCSVMDFAEAAKPFSGNPHAPKAIAYALAHGAEARRAIETIDALLPTLNPNVGWEQDIARDVTSLRAMLLEDPVLAQKTLREWETETIQKLGLAKFR